MSSTAENRFYDLLGRKLAGEATVAELKELDDMLQHTPGFQFLYDQVMRPATDEIAADTATAYMAHYVKMMYAKNPDVSRQEQKTSKNLRKLLVRLSIAASLIFIAGIGWWAFNNSNNTLVPSPASAATPRGSKSTLTLPDGTIVHLNTNSNISYGADFGRTTRDVTLTGEACFEVVHNARVPFIVHTSTADIKVLGTVFNVRNYGNEPKMEASLLKGSIELTLAGDHRKIRLRPSDKVVIEKAAADSGQQGTKKSKEIRLTNIHITDSIIVETSWLNNKMAFADTPLSEIALNLEQQFGVSIQFKNTAPANYRYTGVFDETNPGDILKILQMIKHFNYKGDDKEIIIY